MNFPFALLMMLLGGLMFGYIQANVSYSPLRRSKWEYFGIWLSGVILIATGFVIL